MPNVLVLAPRTRDPCISSEQTGGTVERYSKMYLACDTPDAKIYYTLDGSVPNTSSRVLGFLADYHNYSVVTIIITVEPHY